jgi:hypothetical protein
MKSMEDCWNYENCKATLCPLAENVELCLWYPDENVCGRRDVPYWVRVQRRIVRLVGKCSEVGFFNVASLRNIKIVREGIRGCNPDSRVFRRRGSAV